ncbi:MAG: serine hydrolase [bacterium]
MTRILTENKTRSAELQSVFKDLISEYEMSFAVVDLNQSEPEIFGYNLDHFIYPASMYKVFIGAEVLRRIEIGDVTLAQKIIVKAPNDVDKDARIFPGDTRKLLSAGEEVSIDQLLDLMLTRSDNTASNCLIDLVGRESITENIIYKNNWHGSEVTRKFLDRIKEEKPYQFSSTTMSCSRHFAEFFYLVEKGKLVSPFVSQKLKEYMTQFNRQSKLGLWLPDQFSHYYAKGGWLETNLYNHGILSLLKAIIKKGWAIIRWSNDAGVAALPDGRNYIIVVFSVTKTINPGTYFPIQDFAKRLIAEL